MCEPSGTSGPKKLELLFRHVVWWDGLIALKGTSRGGHGPADFPLSASELG
jgi:hypothetical protein